VKGGGDQSNPVDRKKQEALLGGGRGNADGNLTFAGDGKFGKLTSLVNKLPLVLRVFKGQLEGFEIAVLSFDVY
jgi:hypothetical protein